MVAARSVLKGFILTSALGLFVSPMSHAKRRAPNASVRRAARQGRAWATFAAVRGHRLVPAEPATIPGVGARLVSQGTIWCKAHAVGQQALFVPVISSARRVCAGMAIAVSRAQGLRAAAARTTVHASPVTPTSSWVVPPAAFKRHFQAMRARALTSAMAVALMASAVLEVALVRSVRWPRVCA